MMCVSRVIAVIVSFQERTLLGCPHSVDEAPTGWRENPLIDRLVMLPCFRGGQNPAAEIAQKKAGTLADSYGGQVNRQAPFLCGP